MKCPLFETNRGSADKATPPYARECLKEECAWWMGGDRVCAVTALAGKLYDIDTLFEMVKDKMPHEEQFRR